MGSSNRYRTRPRPGDRAVCCDTCGVRYLRSQLVRGPDGLLRCSGSGTLDDARGRTALELDELQAQAAEESAAHFDYCEEDLGGRFDRGLT